MSTRPLRPGAALAGLILLCAAAAPGRAQSPQAAVVGVERENFRAAPRGAVLAEVVAGAPLTLTTSRDGWREATVEGWIWSRSVRSEGSGDHDLVVSAGDGENLRAAPNGEVVARLRAGTGLRRLEERGSWVRVRRAGWIWEPSVTVRGPAPAPAGAGPASQAQPPSADARERPAPAARQAPPQQAGARREFTAAGGAGLVVMDRSAGDTLARVQPGTSIEVLAREGDWTRVRVEGWVVTASLGPPDTTHLMVLRDVSTEFIQQRPDYFRGRLVDWEAQFIGLQQAERFRSEFLEGEPYILARGPGDEAGFVYIAVPAELLAQVRALSPLERIRVIGRIRSARSALTGAPVIDLLELRPRQR